MSPDKSNKDGAVERDLRVGRIYATRHGNPRLLVDPHTWSWGRYNRTWHLYSEKHEVTFPRGLLTVAGPVEELRTIHLPDLDVRAPERGATSDYDTVVKGFERTLPEHCWLYVSDPNALVGEYEEVRARVAQEYAERRRRRLSAQRGARAQGLRVARLQEELRSRGLEGDAVRTHHGSEPDSGVERISLTLAAFEQLLGTPQLLHLYHHTSAQCAAQIVEQGRMVSREQPAWVYFTNRADSEQGAGYGDTVVHVVIPAELARADDEYGEETHYAVKAADIKPENIIGIVN